MGLKWECKKTNAKHKGETHHKNLMGTNSFQAQTFLRRCIQYCYLIPQLFSNKNLKLFSEFFFNLIHKYKKFEDAFISLLFFFFFSKQLPQTTINSHFYGGINNALTLNTRDMHYQVLLQSCNGSLPKLKQKQVNWLVIW